MEELYPLILSYVCPKTKIKHVKYCANEAQADEAFRLMFNLYGPAIKYSVD